MGQAIPYRAHIRHANNVLVAVALRGNAPLCNPLAEIAHRQHPLIAFLVDSIVSIWSHRVHPPHPWLPCAPPPDLLRTLFSKLRAILSPVFALIVVHVALHHPDNEYAKLSH